MAGTKRPLAQLNNRFARSVVISYVDAAGQTQTMDLLNGPDSDKNVGWPFTGNPEAAGTGFQAIHLERIKQAIQNKAGPAGLQRRRCGHPDRVPAPRAASRRGHPSGPTTCSSRARVQARTRIGTTA